MKKLLFITPGFPKDETETHVVPFVQQFLLAFHRQYPEIEMTIVAIHKPISNPYLWHDIPVIPLNGNDVKYPAKVIFLAKSWIKVRQLQREKKFNGVLNFWYHEFSVMTHRLFPKSFTWFQGQDVRENNRTLRFFKPNPKKVVAISPFNNNILFESVGIDAHKIIPIGIDVNAFPELNTGNRQVDLFGAGWLTSLKNSRLFLEVILELKKLHPNIVAEIAGTGNEEKALKQFVAENQLENNVHFLGLLPHAEILKKMNQSKIFLHTSTFEGGATVYSEALFSGCQLIGTLPLFDREMKHFHLAETKNELVSTAQKLLENLPPTKQILYYQLETVCEEIYKLFY